MTEEEFRSGVMADGTRLMQPDNFISDALRTLSPSWHGEKVAKHIFVSAVNDAIKAANRLDLIKKTLFYGRDNNLDAALGQMTLSALPDILVMPGGADPANVIHAIIGKFTEAGELLEALKACMNGEAFDRINAIEEVGDGFWYDAILLNEMSTDFSDAQNRVIAKLRARFPDKFTEVNANERDLAAERAILEREATAAIEGSGKLATLADSSTLNEVPVSEAEKLADAGFAAHTVGTGYTDTELKGDKSELGKGIGHRSAPMAGEGLSRQYVRPNES